MESSRIDRKARLQLTPAHAGERPPAVRLQDFAEILILHTPEAARAEAARCLQCANAPCQAACPLHNDIPRAMALIEAGEFSGAALVYRETSTLPEVCGRICPEEFCQHACTLGKMGKAIDTRHLEAFVSTHLRQTQSLPQPELAPPTGKTVAVAGGGPAGLAVAELLARKGHAVAVYERHPHPGGLLLYGIPRFKLGQDVVEGKLAELEMLGIEFHCNVIVGVDISITDLQARYDAVFIGIGAHEHYTTGLPGEDLAGIYPATEFLCRTNLSANILPAAWQTPLKIGPRVHIIGGGNTAIDCLRTARRLPGVTEVACYYRRSETEMPACAEEYRHALEEGVKFVWQTAPTAFIGNESGHICAVEYQAMELCDLDESGRCRPVPIPGSEFTVPADAVILALGYSPDSAFVQHIPGLEADRRGKIRVDDLKTGRTNLPGLFAAGDVVRGADLLAPAIADARGVAEAMDTYLRGLEVA